MQYSFLLVALVLQNGRFVQGVEFVTSASIFVSVVVDSITASVSLMTTVLVVANVSSASTLPEWA
jgi:hypothetical protein